MAGPVNMVTPEGDVQPVDEANITEATARGWRVENAAENAQRITGEVKADRYGGVVGGTVATGLGVLRGVTGGLSDIGARAIGAEEDVAGLREEHPYLSTGGEVLGGINPAGFGGMASRLGQRIAKTAEGAGVATKLARGTAGYAAEGGLQGLGTGVSELALSDDPLTMERATSVLSSNVLLGGAIGGGAGLLGKAAEIGLVKAKGALADIAERGAASQVTGDLAGLDAKSLRAAHDVELESIEATRVPARKALAEDVAAFRKEVKDSKIWLATKGAEEREIREIGKISLKADRQLDNLLNNPKALADNPKRALTALQQQEHALEQLSLQGDNLRVKFASDTSGERLAALERGTKALEQNRALQAKIAEISAPPSSPRLAAIADAREALAMPKAPQSMGEKMASGVAYSLGSSAVSAIPFVGPMMAPFAGAAVAGIVGEKVFGRLAKGVAEQAGRTGKALDTFLSTARRIAPAAPVLATKVLVALRYAKASEKQPEPVGTPTLAKVYKERAAEIRSQTQYTPTGVQMRPEARLQMAASLDAVRAGSPIIADRMETLAARRLEFLASKLPRKPDLQALQTGPDHWQPSDMEMRTFARYAAAVEDPGGIEERLASGQITPEDADVMRSVYPERYAHIQQQLVTRLPELRAQLPYARRLALSIFSGVPIDPSMNPRVLAVLQGSYASEDNAAEDGGPPGPKAKPAFGSVKSVDKTLSEQRQGA